MLTTPHPIHPAVHLVDPADLDPGLSALRAGLSILPGAARGDLLGVALGHGIGPRYSTGAVSEYCCAFLANGDDATCDGTIMQLPSAARKFVNRVNKTLIAQPLLGQRLGRLAGIQDGEFQTVHLRHTMVLFPQAHEIGCPGPVNAAEMFVERPTSAAEAAARHAELKALFEFLNEWHDHLRLRNVALPYADALLAGL